MKVGIFSKQKLFWENVCNTLSMFEPTNDFIKKIWFQKTDVVNQPTNAYLIIEIFIHASQSHLPQSKTNAFLAQYYK